MNSGATNIPKKFASSTPSLVMFDWDGVLADSLEAFTSNLSVIPLNVLNREGVRCVSEVRGAETDTSKVRKIRYTMSRYPSRPAFYLGDTKGDMIEGRSAGAKTIAAGWGGHGEEKLKEGKPDFMARSPAELASFFC